MDVCSRVAQRILLRVYSKLLTPLDCLLRSFGRTLHAVKTRSPKVEFRPSPKVLPQTSLPQGFWRPAQNPACLILSRVSSSIWFAECQSFLVLIDLSPSIMIRSAHAVSRSMIASATALPPKRSLQPSSAY